MNIKKISIQLLQTGKPRIPAQKSPAALLRYAAQSSVFLILVGCSQVYTQVVRMRLFLYQQGVFSPSSLPCTVISVGNITTGGTGKTPTVIEIAKILQQHGKRTAILTRGYRRKAAISNYVVESDADVRQVGDEPLLMLHKLHDTPVIVGSQRYMSGKLALARFQPDVMLLDDGFQHLQLRRDLDLVLIDATNPFGGGYLLPAGLLREPLRHLRRAHAFLITRCNEVPGITPILERLRQINADAPIFTGRHGLEALREVGLQAALTISNLHGKRLLAVCGLGNPASFHTLLSSQHLNVASQLDFADHHWYTAQDLDLMRRIIAQQRIDALITTEKDETKLFSYCESLGIPCYVAAIRLEIQPAKAFETFLLASIG